MGGQGCSREQAEDERAEARRRDRAADDLVHRTVIDSSGSASRRMRSTDGTRPAASARARSAQLTGKNPWISPSSSSGTCSRRDEYPVGRVAVTPRVRTSPSTPTTSRAWS